MVKEELRIKDIIFILRKRIKSIILFTLIVGILSSIINLYNTTPVYKSSVRVFIGARPGSKQEYSINDLKAYKDLVASYVEVINSNSLVDRSISRFNIKRSCNEIIGNLSVKPVSDTQVLQITYKDTDKEMVKQVLQAISDEAVAEIGEVSAGSQARVIDKVEVPDAPSLSRKLMYIAMSALLGFILSCLLALFSENFNDKIKSVSQVESELNIDVLGVIPSYKKKKGGVYNV